MTTWSDDVWTDPDKAEEIWHTLQRTGDLVLAAKIEKHWGLDGLPPERVAAEFTELSLAYSSGEAERREQLIEAGAVVGEGS